MKFYKKNKVLLTICLMLPMVIMAQIKVSKKIQMSKAAKSSENALYFIDFWATWCGPCVYASEYLSVLQKQYTNAFYVVSMSEENPELVERYLKRRPTDLAVFIDYQGDTFKKYAVPSLPYGVLLNANGDVVWKGNAADFKARDLERFLRNNKSKITVHDLFNLVEPVTHVENPVEYSPKSDFEFQLLPDALYEDFQIIDSKTFVEYKGSLQDVLAYLLKVHVSQVQIQTEHNKQYHFYIKKNTESFDTKLMTLLQMLDLEQETKKAIGTVLVFNIQKPTFWDTNQINWGENTAHYLIDDSTFKADNITFQDMKYQLANLIEMPIVIHKKETLNDRDLHDWQIHYKYFDLMQTELLDSYGIQSVKNEMSYPVYIINKKKTP